LGLRACSVDQPVKAGTIGSVTTVVFVVVGATGSTCTLSEPMTITPTARVQTLADASICGRYPAAMTATVTAGVSTETLPVGSGACSA